MAWIRLTAAISTGLLAAGGVPVASAQTPQDTAARPADGQGAPLVPINTRTPGRPYLSVSFLIVRPAVPVFVAVTVAHTRRSRPGWTERKPTLRITRAVYAAAVLSITFFPITAALGKYANQIHLWNRSNVVPIPTTDATAITSVITFVPLGIFLPLISCVFGDLGRLALARWPA
ncbi:hypothetical protein AB0F03_37205 [Streptomyces sp. NPDC028722]|uniref:hypothetical protein n=1 Tax=Streptomyces sp. NPDC028722 TaxID=3155016 RepID=UPI00340C27D7